MANETIGKASRRCGNCEHRRIVDPKNLGSGICFAGPQQLVALPAPGGRGIIIQPMRPPADANDPHCSDWQQKGAATTAEVAKGLADLDLSGTKRN
jgi:hypothetical protein